MVSVWCRLYKPKPNTHLHIFPMGWLGKALGPNSNAAAANHICSYCNIDGNVNQMAHTPYAGDKGRRVGRAHKLCFDTDE